MLTAILNQFETILNRKIENYLQPGIVEITELYKNEHSHYTGKYVAHVSFEDDNNKIKKGIVYFNAYFFPENHLVEDFKIVEITGNLPVTKEYYNS